MRVPLNIVDYLNRGSFVFPDRIAVVDEPNGPGDLGSLTFADLLRRSRGMAGELERMGIGSGDRVAIVSQNSARFLITLFGCSGFGRVVVPINFRLNQEEITYIVQHSGARVLLYDPSMKQIATSIDVEHHIALDGIADAALFNGNDDAPTPVDHEEDLPASINYTSGTTARPKGVELTHRNLWLSAAMFGWHTGVNDRDVYLHTLPTFHCNGWGMPYALAGMGAKQVVLRKVEGEEILKRVAAHDVSLMCGAPAVVSMVLDAAEARRQRGEPVPGRDRVRMVVAGAPPPSKTIERMETELGWEFIQIYGLTETAPLLTINRSIAEWDDLTPAQRATKLSRAGVPAMDVELKIDDEGEILARSNHVFRGYWEQPDQTAAVQKDGYFHTGDGAYFDGPFVTITDRKKDVIISGGENVSSIEVEDCLYQNEKVAECAVIGVPHEKWGETVVALVVLKVGCAAEEEEIIEFTRGKLAHFKCPTCIEFRDALPRTATGKLQKFKLRDEFWHGQDRKVN